MFDFITGSFVYTLVKDAIGVVLRKRHKLTPNEILERRQKWKPLFEQEIRKTRTEKLRQDVIVRDMKRIDHYPDAREAKGISPWFRVGLVGTYHRAIYLALAWDTLRKDVEGTGWREATIGPEQPGDIRVVLLGSVPYETIDNVDWNGDEYYPYPHIYCFFNHKKQPYEHVGYYSETKPPDGPPFYTELVAFDEVRKLMRK